MKQEHSKVSIDFEWISKTSKSNPLLTNKVKAIIDPFTIKENLIAQLTGPVKWTQCVQAMVADGATHFTECGPGKVLQGLVNKINKEMATDGVS